MTTLARTQPAEAPAVPVVAPFTDAAPSQSLDARNRLDDILRGLAGVPVPEEGARRAARVAMLRARLEQLGGWLMALPDQPARTEVIDQVIRWWAVEPRDPARPEARFVAALENVAERAERYLNANAVGLAYAVVAPGTDDRAVLAVLEDTAHRFCGQAPLWRYDHEPAPGYVRPALRSVLELAESRRIHVLVIPSLEHLPPADPQDEDSIWTLPGIWDRLRAHGLRLVTADHGAPLADHDVEERC